MLNCNKVLEGLRHFLSHNVEVTSVKEVVDPLIALVIGL